MSGLGMSAFQEPTNRANGLTHALQGRLLACEHDSRRVTRQELDGSLMVIANSFQGRRLIRPNDVVVKSDGCIYVTDPWTNPLPHEQWDLGFAGVYLKCVVSSSSRAISHEQWDLSFAGVYRITPDPGTVYTALDDSGKLLSNLPDRQRNRRNHHTGQDLLARDAHDAPLHMFILAWEGRP